MLIASTRHQQVATERTRLAAQNFTSCECFYKLSMTQFLIMLFFINSHEVIKQTNDISGGIGLPDWQLALWLLLAWISVFVVIVKGVKSSGKFSYFLAIFPYIVIFILLVRGLTLEGAWDGIKFFITPDFKRLIEPQVRISL